MAACVEAMEMVGRRQADGSFLLLTARSAGPGATGLQRALAAEAAAGTGTWVRGSQDESTDVSVGDDVARETDEGPPVTALGPDLENIEGLSGFETKTGAFQALTEQVESLGESNGVDCVTRLDRLRQLWYPGVRVARDDSVLGSVRSEAGLAAALGGDWRPVGSLDVVAAQVERLRSGASAFVLVSSPTPDRPGHGFALRNVGGELFWVETQAPQGVQVIHVQQGPWSVPLGARAIVVGPDGRAVALDPGPGSSFLDAVVDPSRDNQYGAFGIEVEDRHLVVGPDMLPGTVLARRSDLKIVVDHHPFWRAPDGVLFDSADPARRRTVRMITEFVLFPHAVLQEEDRPDIENGLDLLKQMRTRLDRVDRLQRPLPLRELLGPEWEITQAGANVRIAASPSGPDHAAYSQVTIGVPVAGLAASLEAVRTLAQAGSFDSSALAIGKEFGTNVATMFASWMSQRGIDAAVLPFLSSVPGVTEVLGYSWLVYHHVSAIPLHDWAPEGVLVKNLLSAASRTPFGPMYAALRPEVREFLSGNQAEIIRLFVRLLGGQLQSVGQATPVTPAVLRNTSFSGITVGDYITAALQGRTPRDTEVSQSETVGMVDYHQLDTNRGRLASPLVLLELRRITKNDSLLLSHNDLVDVVRMMRPVVQRSYGLAESLRAQNSFAVRDRITLITENPLVKELSRALDLLSNPTESRTGRLRPSIVSERERTRIAEELGKLVIGDYGDAGYIVAKLREISLHVTDSLSWPNGHPMEVTSDTKSRLTSARWTINQALPVLQASAGVAGGVGRGIGQVMVNMAHVDEASVNGLSKVLAEAIEDGNNAAADGLRRVLVSRQKETGFEELAELGRRRRAASPQAGSWRTGSSTARSVSPYIDVDPKSGIMWASSQYSARNVEGDLIPKNQRSCVEVTVIDR
jgi:hypothetical protein